ncbi:COX15/CtaA family protein [Paenibacillus sp. HB172176]|uniref:COX15/CtaA family protein n=1 Tax=Paenibacillus sp. HB172176 TaxID=2493690 RepID=UPI00143C492E|nr:COX15/CtaA family protein [Paenibacillus sp. HB172176]
MITARYRAFVLASSIGMLLVLLAGALVTNTGSGDGCGTDWPLCHGKFVPAHTLSSTIEYTHRGITGLEGLLVLGVAIATYLKFRRDKKLFREPLWYAAFALLFTIVQALMGAAAVIWSQSSAVMAIHFGISLIAFAATMLLVIWVYRHINGSPAKFVVTRSVFPSVLAASVYCYVVIYLGAFVRHTDSSGGCLGWPLCNGEVVPQLDGATGVVFMHRAAAMLLGIALFALYMHIRKVSHVNSGLVRPAGWVLILVITQIISGAILTSAIGHNDVFIFASLLHNLIIVGLFGLLMDILIRSWLFREGRVKG